MPSSFYTSSRWLRLRERVLRRDKYLCTACARYGRRVPATVVHHIKQREFYPELSCDPDNLTSLCDACHNRVHPERAARKQAPPSPNGWKKLGP